MKIVLLPSVLGVTPGLTHFANQLRQHKHSVDIYDIYEGKSFSDYEKAFAHLKKQGDIPYVIDKSDALLQTLTGEEALLGISNGGGMAAYIAQTIGKPMRCVIINGFLPRVGLAPYRPALKKKGRWHKDAMVQMHRSDKDPFSEEKWIRAFEADLEKDGVKPEKHIYKTGEHQFFDNSLPGYDEALSRQLLDNINAFLKYGSKP